MPSSPERAASAAALVFALLAACTSSTAPSAAEGPAPLPTAPAETPRSHLPGRACPPGSTLTYASFGAPFLLNHCTGCHASGLEGAKRLGAPPGVDLDTLPAVRSSLARIYARAADEHTTMPPGGGPDLEARRQLGDWLACGAPGDDLVLSAPSLPPEPDLPARCTARPSPLPASALPRCSGATFDCVAACDILDFGCEARCVAADTTPPVGEPGASMNCASCLSYQRYACSDANGCHEVNARAVCCQQERCAGSTDPSCVVRECEAEAYAYGYCLSSVTPTCQSLASGPARTCFPPR